MTTTDLQEIETPVAEKEHVPKQRKLMILIGPSGVGKTTFAKDYIKNNPGWVRVSRDDQRRQMFGELNFGEYFQSNNAEMEKHVTNLQMEQIRYWLSQGFSVIVDNTHLKNSYLKTYQDNFGHMAEIMFVPVTKATAEECKERVKKREGEHVDVSYIDKHFRNFNNLLSNAPEYYLNRFHEKKNPLMAEFRTLNRDAKQECIIVDIDGTVADCKGIRSPYDGEKCHLDRPIEPVRRLLHQMKMSKERKGFFSQLKKGDEDNQIKIIYLSGREEKYREATERWLIENGFPYDGELYMRSTGDVRADHVIKSELLINEIAPYYKPLFAVDDRLQVCHNVWYKAGIFCLNVNQGLKIF